MKFKLDENIARECAEALRAAGYDALTVHNQGMSGSADHIVSDVCRAEGRILITADLDLSDMRRYPPGASPGTIVLRLRDQSRSRQTNAVGRLIPLLAREPIAGRLWIVDDHRVRIRNTLE